MPRSIRSLLSPAFALSDFGAETPASCNEPPICAIAAEASGTISKFNTTNIGTPLGPPKRALADGALTKCVDINFRAQGPAMYRFNGIIAVVSVVPSLVSRTIPVSMSTLLGRTRLKLRGTDCFRGLPSAVIAMTNWPWSVYDDKAL